MKSRDLQSLVRYFLKLGTFGFGGPIALIGCMERDLIEDRKWFSKEEYLQGLALAQLTPGPMAVQLAMYLGYMQRGILGATLAGVSFVTPSFIMVVFIAAAYAQYGDLTWVHALFYGLGAAVIGIISRSAYRLTKTAVGDKYFLWALYGSAAALVMISRKPQVWFFALSGVAAVLYYAPPAWLGKFRAGSLIPMIGLLAPRGHAAAPGSTLTRIFLFFMKAGSFVFGSGLAIIPFLYGDVVNHFHWLTERQFLDAVAVAMITPGPVVITVAFIGYLVAGLAGAGLAALGVFLPIYLIVIVFTPWFQKHNSNPMLGAFVRGITAAAIGAMSGSVFLLVRDAVYDIPTGLIFLFSLLAVFRFKIPEPVIIGISGVAGLLFFKG